MLKSLDAGGGMMRAPRGEVNLQAMQTFKQGDDAFIKSYPQNPQEWETNPEIKFTVARDRIVHPGDRIFMCTKRITTGPNSGGIADIYYYIKEITDVAPNKVHVTNTDITALAIRREL